MKYVKWKGSWVEWKSINILKQNKCNQKECVCQDEPEHIEKTNKQTNK